MGTRTFAMAIVAAAVCVGALRAELLLKDGDRAFFFSDLDSSASIGDLLPIPPKAAAPQAWPMDDLANVPEVFFQDPHSLAILPRKIQRTSGISMTRIARNKRKIARRSSPCRAAECAWPP